MKNLLVESSHGASLALVFSLKCHDMYDLFSFPGRSAFFASSESFGKHQKDGHCVLL